MKIWNVVNFSNLIYFLRKKRVFHPSGTTEKFHRQGPRSFTRELIDVSLLIRNYFRIVEIIRRRTRLRDHVGEESARGRKFGSGTAEPRGAPRSREHAPIPGGLLRRRRERYSSCADDTRMI